VSNRSFGLLSGALSRSTLYPLDIQDRHRAWLQSDPAAGGKIGKSLIDGFTRGADKLRQLLLGQIMMHMHAIVPLVAEPLRQLQQLLGNPAGDIGEDQVGNHIVGPAKSRSELTEQALSNLWSARQPGNQFIVLERPQLARGYRGGGS
jgi:hypothetical protein